MSVVVAENSIAGEVAPLHPCKAAFNESEQRVLWQGPLVALLELGEEAEVIYDLGQV